MRIGSTMPATTSRGSTRTEMPEIITSGIAKPTAPFTNPATRVTHAA